MLVTAEIGAQKKKGFCYANDLKHLLFFQEWCVTSVLCSYSGELLHELSFFPFSTATNFALKSVYFVLLCIILQKCLSGSNCRKLHLCI